VAPVSGLQFMVSQTERFRVCRWNGSFLFAKIQNIAQPKLCSRHAFCRLREFPSLCLFASVLAPFLLAREQQSLPANEQQQSAGQ